MQVVKTISEMQKISLNLKREGKSIAVVPTMGYLHEGHLNLIDKARSAADIVVMTLFVNPTQFAPNEDFGKYPRDFERDRLLAAQQGADYLFAPEINEMYPKGYSTVIKIGQIASVIEGASRPGHFEGVAMIVAKLFNSVLPDYAVFGQKDYQQTLVIKQLVSDLNFPVHIIVAPTVREADGLAMSSRNSYLSREERSSGSILFVALQEALKAIENGTRDRKILNAIMLKELRSVQAIRVDYACAAHALTLDQPPEFISGEPVVLLISCWLGKTRLIDNALTTIPGQGIKKLFVEGI